MFEHLVHSWWWCFGRLSELFSDGLRVHGGESDEDAVKFFQKVLAVPCPQVLACVENVLFSGLRDGISLPTGPVWLNPDIEFRVLSNPL